MPVKTSLRICLVAVAFVAMATAGLRTAAADTACSLYASPTGSDTAVGSFSHPVRTVQEMADRLGPGDTACLKPGLYVGNVVVRRSGRAAAPIFLRALTPREATIRGQLRIAGNHVIVTDLELDGTNPSRRPSPLVNGDDSAFLRNDVSSDVESCFVLGDPTWGVAARTRIEGNVIHDCGIDGTNRDHGVYVRNAVDTLIEGNIIRDNPDRGVQLYPNADRTTVRGNVIDRNGEGVIFSGDSVGASDGNVVEGNIVTDSVLRWDVESYWEGRAGTGNVLRHNCVSGGARGAIQSPQIGFTATDNDLATVEYAARGGSAYKLAEGSSCRVSPPVLSR